MNAVESVLTDCGRILVWFLMDLIMARQIKAPNLLQ